MRTINRYVVATGLSAHLPIHTPLCRLLLAQLVTWSLVASDSPAPLLHRAVLYGAIGSACSRDGCNFGYIYPSRDTTTVRLLRHLRLL